MGVDKLSDGMVLEIASLLGFGQDGYGGFGDDMAKARTGLYQIASVDRERDSWIIDPVKVNKLLAEWGSTERLDESLQIEYVIPCGTVVGLVNYGIDVQQTVIHEVFEQAKEYKLKYGNN